jgi:hypothetical protein
MPVTYDQDDARQLIIATATDPYTLDEVLGIIERQAAEHTRAYATFSDLRAVTVLASLTQALGQLVDRARLVGVGQPPGPVGIAITPRPDHVSACLEYSRLASKMMDLEILLSPKQIEDWFMRHARGASPPPSR